MNASHHRIARRRVRRCRLDFAAAASQDPPQAGPKPANLAGLHDFDFLVGNWRVHHRRLKERLADSHEWIEFEGTCSMRPLMDGYGNVDDNFMDMPGGAYRGVGLRSYDPKTGQWAIWWLDSRMPSNRLDPPVRGRLRERRRHVLCGRHAARQDRFACATHGRTSRRTSAHWEQAYSPDGGKTWETNWTMEFERASS